MQTGFETAPAALCPRPCRRAPECREAVAALARHVLLKAPDRAEPRAAAVEAAVSLVGALGAAEHQQMVVFMARLSRTPKVWKRRGLGSRCSGQ